MDDIRYVPNCAKWDVASFHSAILYSAVFCCVVSRDDNHTRNLKYIHSVAGAERHFRRQLYCPRSPTKPEYDRRSCVCFYFYFNVDYTVHVETEPCLLCYCVSRHNEDTKVITWVHTQYSVHPAIGLDSAAIASPAPQLLALELPGVLISSIGHQGSHGKFFLHR